MDKVKRFFELKQLWMKADESNRAEIDREMTELLDSMSPEESEMLVSGVSKDFERMHEEVKEIENIISVRNALADVLPIISVSYLAKNYFGKSTSWFYQRMNGNKVHGKMAMFTKDELNTLADALKQIGNKISNSSASLI